MRTSTAQATQKVLRNVNLQRLIFGFCRHQISGCGQGPYTFLTYSQPSCGLSQSLQNIYKLNQLNHSRLSSCIPPLRRHSTLDNPRLKTEEGRMKMLEDRRTRGSRQRMSGGAGSLVSHSLLKRVGAVFYLFDRHNNIQDRIKTFESRQQDWET